MSGQPPTSSHTCGPPQPINPYEASRTPQRAVAAASAGNLDSPGYAARLDWSDRQAFLKSVLPARIAIVGVGLLWGKNLYDQLDYSTRAFMLDGVRVSEAFDLTWVAVALLAIVQGVLALYLCWLGWQYVDRLQAVAGGKTRSLHLWSRLHLQTERLGAVAAMLAVLIEVADWLISRWMLIDPLGGLG